MPNSGLKPCSSRAANAIHGCMQGNVPQHGGAPAFFSSLSLSFVLGLVAVVVAVVVALVVVTRPRGGLAISAGLTYAPSTFLLPVLG